MMFISPRKFFKPRLSTTLAIWLMTLGIPAHADTTQQTNAKIRLARKAVTSGSISPFATPELKRLAAQGEKIIQQRYPGDLVCDIAEHFYLGWGNGDYEEEQFQQLKIFPQEDGRIRASYLSYGRDKETVIFDISCNGTNCQIRDVENPTIDFFPSFKRTNEYIIKNKDCPPT